jgi:hypothetical protein
MLQFLQVFFVSSAVLIPRQSLLTLGCEIFGVTALAWWGQLVSQIRYARMKSGHPAKWLAQRVVTTHIAAIPHGPLECSGMAIMPKHDHHIAAAHHDEAAKSHRDAAAAHDEGDTEKACQYSQIANDHSKKAQEASNQAHQKTKGPKTL